MSEKDEALKARFQRQLTQPPRIDNDTLWAGSPMYYYCRDCGVEMVLPETHSCMAPRYCKGCKIIRENGWND